MSAGEGCFDKMELSIPHCLLMVKLTVLLTIPLQLVLCASFVGAHLQVTVL